MSDTLSVSSAEDNEDDDAPNQAHTNESDSTYSQLPTNENGDTRPRSTLWTVPDEPSSDGATSYEESTDHDETTEPDAPLRVQPRRTPREARVHQPADPYASRIHIPSGRPLATFAKRFTAYVIDGVVFGAFLLYLEFWIRAFTLGTVVYEALNAALTVYYVLLVGGARGQTPGMRAMKIAVRDMVTGQTVGYRNAVKRTLLMWLCSIPFEAGLIVDCLWPLWNENQQALHDRWANTVVIDVSHPPMTDLPGPSLETMPSEPTTATRNGKSPRTAAGTMVKVAHIARRAIPRSKKFWITATAVLVTAAVVAGAIAEVAKMNTDAHSPGISAVAYLTARAEKNVRVMLHNAEIVTPPPSSQKATDLLTPRDIATEIRAPDNSTEPVSHVRVVSTHIDPSGNAATVTIDYVAGGAAKTETVGLVASNANASGWAVQIEPAELDIAVPEGTAAVTVDGMAVTADAQEARAWLLPTVAQVAAPATVIFEAQSQSVDLTGASPNGAPTEVTFAPHLTAQAIASAQAAVAAQISGCLAATSLTPANCPNADIPATTSQGDTYSGIAWTGLGDPTGGMTVTLDPGGTVTVAGSISTEVTYTDTTSGDAFFGSISNQQTDGPTSVWFTYLLTWNGTAWSLGAVQGSTTPPANQPSSST